jgi:DNA-nicking Smr family endonuclease
MAHDDMELFQQLLGDVTPLKQDTAALSHRSKVTPGQLAKRAAATTISEQDSDYLTLDNAPMLKPDDHVEFKRSGVQDGVYRKLRLGKYPIQARLDLHRRTLEQARDEIVLFFKQCIRMDIRSVVIIHGKGERSNPPALMKSYVSHWMTQIKDVQCAHTAQRQQGGSGALYVMLRKSQEKKAENRERHQKRRP